MTTQVDPNMADSQDNTTPKVGGNHADKPYVPFMLPDEQPIHFKASKFRKGSPKWDNIRLAQRLNQTKEDK